MMRQSMAPGRPSHAGSLASSAQNAAMNAKLAEKKKELEGLMALEQASAMLVKRMEAISDDCDVMGEAGIVCGQVLAQWPNMFRILNTYVSEREANAEGNDEEATEPQKGERLVRVPLEELQTTDQGPRPPSSRS